MLFVSLVVSLVLLLITNLVARRLARPTGSIFLIGLAFTFGPCLMMFLLPVAIQAALLVVAAIICQQSRGRRSFLPWSCAATFLAYAVSTSWVAHEFSEMREQFPYVSMETRIPVPKSRAQSEISGEALQGLEMLEGAIVVESDRSGFRGQLRVNYLRQLHEDAVLVFINQPGFGVTRMPLPTKSSLAHGLRPESSPVPQPVSNYPQMRSPGEWDTLLPPRDEKFPGFREDLFGMHRDSVVDFVNPVGFGYVKDRLHVAGFQPHQFSKTPEPTQLWTVQTIDLVGLLLHEQPVVYVSANLPRMDELREVPVRALDDFESAGLEALRRGEDLYIRDTAAGPKRMLGALRSAQQCVACHGGERGDLLGAFSYVLAKR